MQAGLLLFTIAFFVSAAVAQVHPIPEEDSHHGVVLFNRGNGSPSAEKKASLPQKVATITDAERSALIFTSYDLEVHVIPAKSELTARTAFTVRNSGTFPLSKLAFQISSSLGWDSFAQRSAERQQELVFGEHVLDTDADHTGQAKEAVVSLLQPLAPGATIDLIAFYSGAITQSGKRLERIGAPPAQAAEADWDKIAPDATALRGYGNVLWYPTATAPALLGDSAKLFLSVGQTKLQHAAVPIHLRLTVEYVGEPPRTAYFCGRREQLIAVSENVNVPTANASGVATAEFSVRPLGFRTPSLFITELAPTVIGDNLISAVTSQESALPAYAAAAADARPLLADWLGPNPLVMLTILNHDGQSFEDGAFLVTSMRAADAGVLTPALVHSMAHAWFSSSHEWLNEGVAHFMTLLWAEESEGRDVALQRLHDQMNTLALAEPDLSKSDASTQAGQSLIQARDEIYYRSKAAAVLWMLRSVVGDEPLKRTLQLYRRDRERDRDPHEFQHVLEEVTKKDLRWFFDDWVYRDRGLPALSIANVSPRQLPAQGGKAAGWLIAVEVRNDGDAVADVPVTVRSGTLTASSRVRVAGRSSASTRILFEGTPEEVVVNDGSVPEVGAAIHRKQLVVR